MDLLLRCMVVQLLNALNANAKESIIGASYPLHDAAIIHYHLQYIIVYNLHLD